MGVLNVTPDSFSDGGAHRDPVAAGLLMASDGADIVDVGGESTRPGAGMVDPAEEQRRVLPVIAALAGRGVYVSVDTRNASTMRAALQAGARMVNDVSALTHDPASLETVAKSSCEVVLMHMRGTPRTMAGCAVYEDVVEEVFGELAARVERAVTGGVARSRITIDPGLGFAKTPEQSVRVLRALPRFADMGLPILVGASRKRFVGVLSGEPEATRRAPGSIAAALFACQSGAAVLRVHDIAETKQALRVWQALTECRPTSKPCTASG